MISPDQAGAVTGQMEAVSWLRVILAFVIVGGLLALLGFGLNYLNLRGVRMPGLTAGKAKRLRLVETLPIDARRRLVLVRCDDREHLLLLGAGQDIVVAAVPASSLQTAADHD